MYVNLVASEIDSLIIDAGVVLLVEIFNDFVIETFILNPELTLGYVRLG